MSFLQYLRDRVVPFLFFFCVIIGGVGGAGWLFANTYFWKTSDVTIVVDPEIVGAKIDIQARIVYKDFRFFEDTYPFHIVLPSHHQVTCIKECVFTDIPAGDAELTLYTQTGTEQREKILIMPDTKGSIDMRTPIRTQKVTLENIPSGILSVKMIDIDPASIFFRNTLQGLALFYDKGIIFLYDALADQRILLGNDLKVRAVVRGLEEGRYLLITETNTVFVFDRYGRQKTEEITHSLLDDKDIIWEYRDGIVTSKLLVQGKERVFPGRLFWFIDKEKNYLFDGENIFEIINN